MSKSHLDSLLSDTSSTLDLLSSLSKDFEAVDSQTSNFEKQCEGLLSAQRRDLELAINIEDNLQYYDFLDPASRRLNAPGAGNSVRGRDFSEMLKRLDECLDYMETHVRPIAPVLHVVRWLTISYSPNKKKQAYTGPGTVFS